MRFTDKVVVILGGNSGIGLASARAFAAEGAQVRITGRHRETIDAAVTEMPGARGFRADIADLAAMDEVYAAIGEADGRIDVLFINAGIGGFAPLRAITEDAWDQVHSVNLKGLRVRAAEGAAADEARRFGRRDRLDRRARRA